MGLLEVLTARDRLLPRSACRYQRLRGGELGGSSPSTGASVRARRPLRLRLRRRACKAGGRWGATTTTANGGGKRLRLRLVRLLLLLPARRVAALVAEVVRRLLAAAVAAADCPAIVFSSQWGLPVLSPHCGSSSRSSRPRGFYLDRSLSGAGSGVL
ncbi:uncharacterized protein [Zea mays]|jgi:hypothetical protein|uniref:Uncharacterized protein n=1 Tax=Zea mays TaxID=4577 RepID=A0A1D6IKL9_MAIZE|nr:uncharacterized protein LOC111589730 [Zea mays]XP_035817051.1 uncharacterized protein LOC111589730 [Zea mays]XP_035817052.1 uncharacterized protein LOC111589730 [Zea mays]ONM59948.1 hypothetical protein ZEAMMB73_Zm00001d022249 [Zea mays]|eukprot:XP_023156362.1 uncharacterized protein LOC111589730 [Zea mays]